jgi:hypothetical protein
MRFQDLTAASMMFRIVFWDVLPCKMIVERRFRGAYCLHQDSRSVEAKRKLRRELKDALFLEEERKSIILLEGS